MSARAALVSEGLSPVHGVVVPAPVGATAQQHVVFAVAVEVSDAGELPVEVAGDISRAAPAGEVAVAVHGVVIPAPVGVAQQHVVLAVPVEVAKVLGCGRDVGGIVSLQEGGGEQDGQQAEDAAGAQHGKLPRVPAGAANAGDCPAGGVEAPPTKSKANSIK